MTNTGLLYLRRLILRAELETLPTKLSNLHLIWRQARGRPLFVSVVDEDQPVPLVILAKLISLPNAYVLRNRIVDWSIEVVIEYRRHLYRTRQHLIVTDDELVLWLLRVTA